MEVPTVKPIKKAESVEQLAKWLRAYYEKIMPAKLDNVPKIAATMFGMQERLDAKLRASYEKGLKYAGWLAGDIKLKKRKLEDSTRAAGSLQPPSKRPPGGRGLLSAAASLPKPSHKPVAKPAPKPTSSPSKTASSADDAVKQFLKDAQRDDLPIEYDQKNPKKEGSQSYDRYEQYKSARTLKEMKMLGGKQADIKYDYDRGFFRVIGHEPMGPLAGSTPGVKASSSSSMDRKTGEPRILKRPKIRKPSNLKVSTSDEASEKRWKPMDLVEPALSSTSPPPPAAIPVDVGEAAMETSAWEITDEEKDVLLARGRQEVLDEWFIENTVHRDILKAAIEQYEAGRYTELLESLECIPEDAEPEAISQCNRLKALVRMRTSPAKLRSCISARGKAEDSGVERTKKEFCFAEELPVYKQEHDASVKKRDLAKESRSGFRANSSDLHTILDKRVREMVDGLATQRVAKTEDSMTVQYTFKDVTETFDLHSEAAFPGHAKCTAGPDGQQVPARRNNAMNVSLDALEQFLESAVHTAKVTHQGTIRVKDLVNRYGLEGATALSVVTYRSTKPDETDKSVRWLLELGADPHVAMDGAIYLADLTARFGWVTRLLHSFRRIWRSEGKEAQFSELVRHRRQTGDTALLVAVIHGDLDVARELLEWGADANDPEQHRKGKSCLDLAQERKFGRMVELLTSHGATGAPAGAATAGAASSVPVPDVVLFDNSDQESDEEVC